MTKFAATITAYGSIGWNVSAMAWPLIWLWIQSCCVVFYGVLCYGVMICVVLLCVVLCNVVLWHGVLWYDALSCADLCCVCCVGLCCVGLCCVGLCCVALCCVVLCCVVLCCDVRCYSIKAIALKCTKRGHTSQCYDRRFLILAKLALWCCNRRHNLRLCAAAAPTLIWFVHRCGISLPWIRARGEKTLPNSTTH